MKIVNMHQAKTQLSKLVERARRGELIFIGKSGRPVAQLSAFDLPTHPRVPGAWKGKIKIAKDFDRLPKRILKLFYGE